MRFKTLNILRRVPVAREYVVRVLLGQRILGITINGPEQYDDNVILSRDE